MTLIWLATVLVGLLCIGVAFAEFGVFSARRRGLYPPKGQVSLNDVRTLALKGEEILAIRAYREMHGASLKKAKKAIRGIVESAGRE